MTYKIRIDQDALADILESSAWYDQQSNGLGARFKKQVKTQINQLKKNALAHGIRYNSVRCVKVHKFPFLIHYVVDENDRKVEVFAVLHAGRNPDVSKSRSE
jgi:mRNA-degrading endonuclease RelE of RelBE toxin-antitoxin system